MRKKEGKIHIVDAVNLGIVYFLYGLAFFSMGLALVLDSGRSPLLAEKGALFLLGLFGLVHGIHEWFEMLLMVLRWIASNPTALEGVDPAQFLAASEPVRLVFLAGSFAILLAFALQSLRPKLFSALHQVLILVGVIGVLVTALLMDYFLDAHQIGQWHRHIEIMIRYILGGLGGGLAALALVNQSQWVKQAGHHPLSRPFLFAAIGIGVYGGSQFVVPKDDFLLAYWVNTTSFQEFFGFPIQALRLAIVLVVTICMLRAIRIADKIRQQELAQAQAARVEALQRLQDELEHRQVLRQDLMRRTVLAQEEERSRIARELHDETAQVLTAFELHLASLASPAAGIDKRENLARLKGLCRQMSDGLYRLVHDLRPALLDDLGLVAAIEYLVKEFHEQSHLETRLSITGAPQRFQPLIETVIFRVTQEALTNIVRHSNTSLAEIKLSFDDPFQLEVLDRGLGFDLEKTMRSTRGLGLVGMRERVEAVGGAITILTAPGSGTRVVVQLPPAGGGAQFPSGVSLAAREVYPRKETQT